MLIAVRLRPTRLPVIITKLVSLYVNIFIVMSMVIMAGIIIKLPTRRLA
jgi:hypothetical protein